MDQGEILGYKPDLEIRPEFSTGVTLEETYSTVDNFLANVEINANRSNASLEFEAQKPSRQIDILLMVINEAKKLKSKLEDNLSSSLYSSDYFNSSDVSEAKAVLDKNSNDLEFGSIYLEIYAILEKLLDEMNTILIRYVQCIFGKDVDIDSIKDIEQTYLDKIYKYECEQKYEKVNYFNLYYDTQISYLIGQYAQNAYTYVYNLGTIKEENTKEYTPDENAKNIIKDSFNRNNLLLNKDISKASNVKDDIDTALNNIFLAKQNVNMYLDTFASIYKMGSAGEDFLKMKQETIDELEQKLDNLVKTVMYSDVAKEDLNDTFKKKSNYRSFFVA